MLKKLFFNFFISFDLKLAEKVDMDEIFDHLSLSFSFDLKLAEKVDMDEIFDHLSYLPPLIAENASI